MILIKKPFQLDLILMPLKRQIALYIRRKKSVIVLLFQRVLIHSGLDPRSGIMSLLLGRNVIFIFFLSHLCALTPRVKGFFVPSQGDAALWGANLDIFLVLNEGFSEKICTFCCTLMLRKSLPSISYPVFNFVGQSLELVLGWIKRISGHAW